MNSTFMHHTNSTFEQHISATEHVKEKYNVHSKHITERQVIADSFCYAGCRGGATEAGGLAGVQLVKVVVDRAAEFYFQKGMPRDMRGHGGGTLDCVTAWGWIRCWQQKRRSLP